MSVLLGVKEVDVERANIFLCGKRWAVEARRTQREDENKHRTKDRSKASKASTYVSVKKNNKKR